MTIETMRWHEAVNLRYDTDFRRQSLVQLVKRQVTGKRVLDMRCLTGTLAVQLAAEGKTVTALDGYAGAVKKTNALARRAGVEQPIAKLWDLTNLAAHVNGHTFDTVVCVDVLNHVRDDEETVRQITRAMKVGGRIVLAVPAFPALLGKRDRSLGHLRRYTRASIRALLERNGLQVESIRFWNMLALPPYLLSERGLKRGVPDAFRYGQLCKCGSLTNRLLTWWYTHVENRIRPPFGMTHIVVAHKRSGNGRAKSRNGKAAR